MSQPTPTQGGAVQDQDVQYWADKLKDVAARPAEVINAKSGAQASSWANSFIEFFSPVDLCLVTWCLPCVTFGKTHHRLNKDANLVGYEPINTSCLLFCGSSCCGLWWLPTALQRADIRERFNLQGSCLVDLAAACCCGCCALVQQSKEAAHQIDHQGNTTGYETNPTTMTYPAKPVA